ncbi:MAG: hypothetical protein AAB434_11795 [Planctomycetota bacterium]
MKRKIPISGPRVDTTHWSAFTSSIRCPVMSIVAENASPVTVV